MPQPIDNKTYSSVGNGKGNSADGERGNRAGKEFRLQRRARNNMVVPPNSLYNLYLDHTDGRPYYHRLPWSGCDPMLVKGVCIEVLWAKDFVLGEILAWYNKHRPARLCDAAKELTHA